MEKRLQKKIDIYLNTFKKDVINKLTDSYNKGCDIHSISNYIYEYHKLELQQIDFQKRKRIKNVVPQYNRCNAKRANGQQCTRRKKEGEQYCGTHIKGRPHGIITDVESNNIKKVTVWVEDIKGIHYYIDDNNNVYKVEDILSNSQNPKVIARYDIVDDTYVIKDL